MSAKGKLVRFLGGSFLRRASVAEVEDVGDFRRLVLRGDVPRPDPGSKFQVLLGSDDMRTYTPIALPDGVALVGWKRAGGPGARFFTEVEVGAEAAFIGPQRSLVLPDGPTVIVGDETSLAVMLGFAAGRPGRFHGVLQVGDVEATREAARRFGLEPVTVLPRDDTAGAVDAVLAARASMEGAIVALTGGSRLVVETRAALRARGVADIKTKTYWVPGRCGLD